MSNSPYDIQDLLQQSAQAMEPRPEFVESLWQEIVATPTANNRGTPFRLHLSPRLAGAIIGLLLLSAVFIVGPQQIVQAFRNLVGYLPGIGFVEEGDGTLYLTEPVSLTQEGVTLTVEQAVADSNKLIIALHIENLPPREGGGFDCMYTDNNVQLPDGRRLHVKGGESTGKDTAFTSRLEFQALPQDVKDFQLQIALPDHIGSCQAPAQWQIDLSLAAKPGDVTLMPVYEEPTAVATDLPAASKADDALHSGQAQTTGTTEDDFAITMERTVSLGHGYRVSGVLLFPQEQFVNADCYFEALQVRDAAGEMVAIEPPAEGTNNNEWAIIVPDKAYHYPLTIECQRISILSMLPEGTEFSFDAGNKPVVSQSWNINQTLLAQEQEIEIKTVTVIGERDPGSIGSSPKLDATTIAESRSGIIPPQDASEGSSSVPGGYRIVYKQAPSIDFVGFSPVFTSSVGMCGWCASGGAYDDSGLHYMDIYFDEMKLATGHVSFRVSDLNHHLDSSWQVQWQPPEGN